MTKITVDKETIERAIEAHAWALDHLPNGAAQTKVRASIKALEVALAEPVVKDCLATEPAVESQKPECYKWEEYRKWGKGWGWDTCEMEYDPRLPENAQYHKGTDFNDPEQVRNFRALYASPPPAEPRISTEHCSLAERQSHQASVNYPSDDLYCPRCQCSERFLQSRRCEPHIVYDVPPPPADVPLLDDMNILRMWHETSSRVPMCNHYNHFARAIEQTVRQNAGLK